MNHREEIDKALGAHVAWKSRLTSAIASGRSEFQVANVQVDNRCDFGKWFYSLPASMRGAEPCVTIQKLHAEFHAEAAHILDMALKGRRDEAEKALGGGSRYSTISGQLVVALTRWKSAQGEGKAAA